MNMRKKEKLKATLLRERGKSVNEIAKELSVSKSSVSVWVRAVPVPEKFTPEARRLRKEKCLEAIMGIREKDKRDKLRSRTYVEKGGKLFKSRVLNGDGYWLIPAPEDYGGKTYIRGLYVYEHRFVLEKMLGRFLVSNEVAHHVDGNPLNNDPSNIELRTRSSHDSEHAVKPCMMVLRCAYCGKTFQKYAWLLGMLRRKGQKNFFCSRECGGFGRRKKFPCSSVGRATGCQIGSAR